MATERQIEVARMGQRLAQEQTAEVLCVAAANAIQADDRVPQREAAQAVAILTAVFERLTGAQAAKRLDRRAARERRGR